MKLESSLKSAALVAALVLTTAAAATPVLAASASSAAGTDFSWNAALAAGKTISVNGISGHITATRVTGRQASVTAVKSGRSSEFDDVRIEATPSSDGITICALYRGKNGEWARCDPEKGIRDSNTEDTHVEVDFTVQVPDGVRLEANQVNGSIDVTDLASDVQAATVNGGIHLSTSGVAEARTVNGSITAAMGRGSWDHPIRFETVNGSVKLTLPHDVNAELHANSVNGSISSDFPVTVSGAFWKHGGTVGGTIGKGGNDLRLSTVNGSIVIARVGGSGSGADDSGGKTKL